MLSGSIAASHAMGVTAIFLLKEALQSASEVP
jgi:hypothetical protein